MPFRKIIAGYDAICTQLVRVAPNRSASAFRPDAWPRLLSIPTLIGFLGSVVVSISSNTRGGQFLPDRPSLKWFVGAPEFLQSDSGRKIALGGFLLGVIAISWAWLRITRICASFKVSVPRIIVILCLWVAPLVLASPLCSPDVYAYVAHGELLSRGYDPYEVGVSVMGHNEFTDSVHKVWRDTSSMYGPLFLALSGLAITLAGHDIASAVLLLRLIVLLSLVMMIIGCVSLAKTFKRDSAEILTLAVLNPVVLVHFVGGIHNDALMVGFLLPGIAAALRGWRIVGLILCAIGAAIKLPAFAGVVIIGWFWHSSELRLFKRIITTFAVSLAGLAILAAITGALGSSWGWVNRLTVPGKVRPLLAPVNSASELVGYLLPATESYISTVFRAGGLLISAFFAISVILKSRDASEQATIRALGWSLFVFALLGPTLFPWYLTWGGILLAVAGPGRLPRVLGGLVIGVNLTVLPNGLGLLDMARSWGRPLTAFLFLVVCIAVLKVGIRRLGQPVEQLTDENLRRDLAKALT